MPIPHSPKRTDTFRYPVLFPEGLRYFERFEDADAVRYELVQARCKAERVCYEQRTMPLKPKSMKGRMG